MADHSGTLIESQVDWLTVSAHGEDAAASLLGLAHTLAAEEKARGNRVKLWHLMGYEGNHVGRVEWGRRDGASCILRLIGNLADEQLSQALSVSDQVTRLDVASTWRAEPPDPFIGRNSYALAEMWHQNHPRSALPSFTGDARGGYTCYLGERRSENFLRIYDKGAECIATNDQEGAERYRACWRFELEAKASVAAGLASLVEAREDRASFIRDYLVSFLEAHGIAPPFVAGQPVSLQPGFRRRSDADTRIKHLARNVKPTLDWLREAGELDRALSALGLEQG